MAEDLANCLALTIKGMQRRSASPPPVVGDHFRYSLQAGSQPMCSGRRLGHLLRRGTGEDLGRARWFTPCPRTWNILFNW